MAVPHKNKTLATLLAFLFGGLGIHRFYLHGPADRWGWVHLSSLALSGIAIGRWFSAPLLFAAAPLVVSTLVGLLTALVLGLTPDEKWDARHNPHSGKQSDSGGVLVCLLVLITGTGAVMLIAVMARALDLLFTGGAYG